MTRPDTYRAAPWTRPTPTEDAATKQARELDALRRAQRNDPEPTHHDNSY